MKTSQILGILALTVLSFNAYAGKINLQKDINSLGEDQAIVDRARALDPKNKVEVVQNRAVDRHWRVELGVDYGLVSGGDSYLSSQNFGGNLDLHINPHFSLGLRYNSYINSLTNEGQQVYTTAANRQVSAQAGTGGGPLTPSIDNPIASELAVLDWYPVYGKLNFFDTWIPHFDLYTLVGYGKTQTQILGSSDTFTAGGGVGLWLTNWLAWRIEVRWETFQDQPFLDKRQVNSVIGQTSLGLLL
jgi:outer membrane immunogenic protein